MLWVGSTGIINPLIFKKGFIFLVVPVAFGFFIGKLKKIIFNRNWNINK